MYKQKGAKIEKHYLKFKLNWEVKLIFEKLNKTTISKQFLTITKVISIFIKFLIDSKNFLIKFVI